MEFFNPLTWISDSFLLGTFGLLVSSLATNDQSHAIDFVEAKWTELVADMPFKIYYPAMEGDELIIITGTDPTNT